MLRADNGENLKGNDRFEGFAADLMKQIAETLGFQYRIQLVNDSKYGGFDGKSGWNGMIGQLIRHEVHMVCMRKHSN
jgi:ionotropic glutamate receptor